VLAAQLLSRFEGATAERRLAGYDPYARVRSDLEEGYAGNVRAGSYKLQADYWRLRADELRALLAVQPAACDAFLRGDGGLGRLAPALEARRQALFTEVLLSSPKEDVARNETGRFMIPGWLIEAAAKRAGLSPDRFVAAMDGKGAPGAQCKARIAILDTALARPAKEAGGFIRQMSEVL
jgi:hypothetical protein